MWEMPVLRALLGCDDQPLKRLGRLAGMGVAGVEKGSTVPLVSRPDE